MADAVVLGQIGRDLVLRVAELPAVPGSAAVRERCELLGGKGANQAVALAQLGVPVALVGVVGDDDPGAAARAQAAADGVDVSAVVRRHGATTALLVDLVEDGGRRRLLEDVPDEVLLTADDVAAAADQIRAAALVAVQLQQPGAAVRAALELAAPRTIVLADGAPADSETRAAVLARAEVVRADATEAELLVGRPLPDEDAAREAAAELLTAGPRLVVLGRGEQGDLVAWRAGPVPGRPAGDLEADPRWADGEFVAPLLGGAPVDPTGAGDAYVAALAACLLAGADPQQLARLAAAAAASTVGYAGGRPALVPAVLGQIVRRHARFDQPG